MRYLFGMQNRDKYALKRKHHHVKINGNTIDIIVKEGESIGQTIGVGDHTGL